MVFNPTLMFERGWEQYVGTAIYFWAVLTLGRELLRLWQNERAFDDAPRLLQYIGQHARAGRRAAQAGHRPGRGDRPATAAILPVRVRQLVGTFARRTHPSAGQLMELNREASGLDQEHMAGRFTLTRYILYLLPVIGFIGTVEGISKALMNISRVLPMVKDLDGFMSNLTGVTSASDRLRQHAAGPVPERRADAGADAGLPDSRRTCWPGSTAGSSSTSCPASARAIRWPTGSPR